MDELTEKMPRLSNLLRREAVPVDQLVANAVRSRGVNNIVAGLERSLKGLGDMALDILSGLAVGRHVMIMGPVGVGKTTLAEEVASLLDISSPPYMEVACHSHMTAAELTGDIDIAVALQAGLDHPLAFIPGPLVMAHGGILILDEINRLNPYSQAALLQALQEHFVFIRGFRIRSDFLVIATSNPSEYSGVYELSEALADRMKVVNINYPDKDVLRAILNWKANAMLEHLGVKVPDFAVEVVANFMTQVSQDGLVDIGPSVRSSIYAISGALSRAWIEGRDISLADLKKEVVSNVAHVIKGNFSNDEEKVNYLLKKFDDAAALSRRKH